MFLNTNDFTTNPPNYRFPIAFASAPLYCAATERSVNGWGTTNVVCAGVDWNTANKYGVNILSHWVSKDGIVTAGQSLFVLSIGI